MIPTGDDWRIRKALGYMKPEKVLQWAQTTICPTINEKDIARIARDMPKGDSRRIGTAKDANAGPYAPHCGLVDNGTLGRKIDALIAARAKECGVHPDFYRRSLGWR